VRACTGLLRLLAATCTPQLALLNVRCCWDTDAIPSVYALTGESISDIPFRPTLRCRMRQSSLFKLESVEERMRASLSLLSSYIESIRASERASERCKFSRAPFELSAYCAENVDSNGTMMSSASLHSVVGRNLANSESGSPARGRPDKGCFS